MPINPVDIGTGADPHDEAEFELPDGEAMRPNILAQISAGGSKRGAGG